MKTLKNVKTNLVLTLLTIAFIAFSCNYNEAQQRLYRYLSKFYPTGNSPKDISNIVSDGTWRITFFFDKNHEETRNFNGYNFTFAPNNTLIASNGTANYTGVWAVTDDNSNDDNLKDLYFNILFISPPDFAELTKGWKIIEKSITEIKLQHVSHGNGGTDFLTLSKNYSKRL